MREHANARLRHDANDPATLAARAWRSNAFPGHPYGLPADGTLETLAKIERADLVAAARRVIARDKLVISVVGAIDEKGAAALVDRVFAELPAAGDLETVPEAPFGALGRIDTVALDVPQSTSVSVAPASSATIPILSRAWWRRTCSAVTAT